MDPDPFVPWALADARTLEERYATELLVEQLEQRWHWKHRTGYNRDWRDSRERERERFLNPAYEPAYSETSVRRAAEMLPAMTEWSFSQGFQHRPVRDFAVLQFLPALEKLTLHGEVAELALLPQLPKLRDLWFVSPTCADYRPLARCANLRRLKLSFGVHWPEVDGLETLQELEMLDLSGNLLVFLRGLVFPRVREGRLACAPLPARNVRDLPQFPACEFFRLEGVERLDGIEAMPGLRNLTLGGPVGDYAPLQSLPALTWFRHEGALPLDVTPLTRVPALLYAAFETKHRFGMDKVPPRDYGPLVESPTLRQVTVQGCPPVELEVAALNAALPSWSDRILLPEPRSLPSLRVIVAPPRMHPQPLASPSAEGAELPDQGVLALEGDWISRNGTAFLADRLGQEAWGHVSASADQLHLTVWVESYDLMTRFGDVIDAVRQLLARLQPEFTGALYVALKVPPREQTAAQAEIDQRFRDRADDEFFAQCHRDEQMRLESLHRFRLKQQQGEPIDPAEFAPEPRSQTEEDDDEISDEEDEDESEEDGDASAGDVAVQKKPDPQPDLDDDEHPLADNYRLMLHFTASEVWVAHRHAPLALHLLDRSADEEFPEDPPQT